MGTLNQLTKMLAKIKKNGLAHESEQGQLFAKKWWDMVMDFTGGDMTLLPELSKLADKLGSTGEDDELGFDFGFIEEALKIYFTNLGYNPFEQEEDS